MNFIYTKQKKQQDIVLDRPHVLISFIHWVNSTILKNVWLIVRQLPIIAGWWDAPLAIWDLDEAMRIIRSKISYTVWSNLNRFFVHQPAATNSMHLQSTHTPHSQRLQWDLHLEPSRRSAVELFCGNSLCVKTVCFFRRGAPSLMLDGILNVTLSEEKVSTIGVTQGNLALFLCPKSPDSQQTQIQEYEVLDWTHVLIFLKENSSSW